MIRNVRIIKETEKAYLCKFVYKGNIMWIPKSCIKSIKKELKNKSIPTRILTIDIEDNFYKKNYIEPKNIKLVPYDDTKEIFNNHRTNTTMTFLGKLKK